MSLMNAMEAWVVHTYGMSPCPKAMVFTFYEG